MPDARIEAIYRYPVKGLSAEPLESIALTAGEAIPFDRAWAIENGPSGFAAAEPQALPKTKFLMLMKNETLAALETRFDEETGMLEIRRHGKRVAGGNLNDPLGRQLIEQFFAAYSASDLRGSPKILAAAGHTFSDCGKKVVSIANLASLRELERAAGRTIHPLRFRMNIYVDGWLPWHEFYAEGEEIALGDSVRVRIRERTVRCAATNVDPETGARDMQIPRTLSSNFGHMDFGVYAEVVAGGTIKTGDGVVG